MKKLLTLTTLCLLFTFAIPQSSYAAGSFTGIDPVQALKEWGIDTVAWFLGGVMTGDLTRSTAEWVNSGFGALARSVALDEEGNPEVSTFYAEGGTSFVLNPQAFFQELSTGAATTFFDQLSAATGPEQAFDTIFPGFKDDLLKEVAKETQGMSSNFFENFVSDFQGTEDEERVSAYLNDFTQGGWDMFLQTTQNCANDYGCTRLAVLGELNERTNQAIGQGQAELVQGGGFLTMRECTRTIDSIDPRMRSGYNPDPAGCIEYRNVTPGKLLGEQITKATNIEFERASDADELTEVIVSLLEQAINTLIDTGLSELSRQLTANYEMEGGIRDTNEQRAQDIDENNNSLRDDLGTITSGEDEGKSETFGNVTLTSDVSRIILNEENPSETVEISHRGDDYNATVELVFTEGKEYYEDFIEIDREGFSFRSTSEDTLIMNVELVNYENMLNPNELAATIKIGELEIEISGSDVVGFSPTDTTEDGCVNLETGGILCAESNISMSLEDNGSVHAFRVAYTGDGDFTADVLGDFGEFNDVITITPAEITIANRSTSQIVLRVSSEDAAGIDDFNDLDGTLLIGPLEIDVNGVDYR